MNQQMKILKEIAQTAGRDDFYNLAKELGEIASGAFGPSHRSQMTNLENIANSTLKVTDVLDYIKKRVARSERNKRWQKDNFGPRLKDYIEENLCDRRQEICTILEGVDENSVEGQRIYLNLIREFVSQLVVHYEYRTASGDEPDESDS